MAKGTKKTEPTWTAGPPPKISDIDLVFPARALEWLPPWDAIPAEFKSRSNPWTQKVSEWFFRGADKEWIARLAPKAGVDGNDAIRVVRACLGSYAPKHEHKEAGVAFLLALWFDDPALTKAA